MPENRANRTQQRRRRRRILAALLATVLLAPPGYYAYQTFVRTNFHTVVEGKAYRSAQPSPEQLKRWAKRYGLRTVINLRGQSDDSFYAAERAACREAGVGMIDIRLSAVRLPSMLWLRRLIEALETAERPILLHCYGGADRTGFASVLAAMAIGQRTYDEARGQLSPWYLHVDDDPDHIAGLLEQYEEYCRRKGAGTGGWEQFRRWALEDYRTYYYFVRITAPKKLSARPGEKLRVPLVIRNNSGRVIPAGDPEKTFNVASFTGSSQADAPDREFGRTVLPAGDIAPGQSVSVEYTLHAPTEPGIYEIHFDLIEERRTWFARQGSPVATCVLEVSAPVGGASR